MTWNASYSNRDISGNIYLLKFIYTLFESSENSEFIDQIKIFDVICTLNFEVHAQLSLASRTLH